DYGAGRRRKSDHHSLGPAGRATAGVVHARWDASQSQSGARTPKTGRLGHGVAVLGDGRASDPGASNPVRTDSGASGPTLRIAGKRTAADRVRTARPESG